MNGNTSTLAKKLLGFEQSLIVGTAVPLGSGYSMVGGKKCLGYARGRAIAYKDNGVWRVMEANG